MKLPKDAYSLNAAEIYKAYSQALKETEELNRKGEELCNFSGNLLIQKHELEAEIARLKALLPTKEEATRMIEYLEFFRTTLNVELGNVLYSDKAKLKAIAGGS